MSEGPTSDDEDVRARIRTQLDATQFVEAGAGTGKTTALVARILELICTGTATLGSIAAITFTEAAAAELRDRIYEALEGVAGGEDAEGSQRAARARAALDEIDGAAISTLHGFAQRILAGFPSEAGLPPVFDVLDQAQSALDFDERWSGFVDRILEDPDIQGVLERLIVCGVTVPHLRAIAEQCNRNWDLLVRVDRRPAPMGPVDAASVLDPLDEASRRIGDCIDPDDRLARHITGLQDFRASLRQAGTDIEVLQALIDAPPLTTRGGKSANWTTPIDEVRSLLVLARDARTEAMAAATSGALDNLMPSLRQLVLGGAEARRREGRLEFHDLLVWALELVRNQPEVRDRLHGEYRRIFVDEFQDTDPIQAELAVRICSGAGNDSRLDQWIDLPVEPGRLFFVGDPKQAIYRFRRADIGLFLAVRRRYEDHRLALTDNFRSVPGIIDWINSIFSRLVGEGEDGVQPAYEPLRSRRPSVDPTGASPVNRRPPVVILGGALPDGSIDDVRRLEADEIASTIIRMRDEAWPVGPGGDPVRLSDMTVLLPARTGLGILQAALDTHGVPYRLATSSLVYASIEVIELLNVLRAVDDPTDQVSVVAALRSAYLGCGDDDLVAYERAGGGWDYRSAAAVTTDDDPVSRAMALLDELHRLRWWRDVSGLVGLVLERCCFFELGIDEHRHRDLWRRLRFVADQARQFADAHGGDLRRFLAWVDLQRRDDVRAVEVVLPEADDEAVQVMTVHGAKGLEFPVVLLAGLGSARRPAGGVSVLWGAEGPEVKVRAGLATAGHGELATREHQMERAQDIRLLYVAATRARDVLVVSLHHKAGTACHAATLVELCETDAGSPHRLSPPVLNQTDRPAGGPSLRPPLDEVDSAGLRQAWIEGRAELLAAGSRPRTVAASTVAMLGSHDPGAPGSEVSGSGVADDGDDDPPPWRRGRAGTSLGRAVHAVLQAVDLGTGEGVEALAAQQAALEGVSGRQREIVALVGAALRSDVVRAAAVQRSWRELYVGAPVGDGVGSPVLEGFIDLLVETDDGLVVVDYKTDSVDGDDGLDRAAERYRLQGATYAVALERALGRRVARCVFLFLRAPGAAEEREIADLRQAMAEVVDLVEEAQIGPWRPSPIRHEPQAPVD